jgi:1-acyl-sn-glycerol-3-phosphate acyltransferase
VNHPDAQALARAGDTRRQAFLRVARRYVRRRLTRELDGVWVSGLAEARAALAQRPLIFVANHVAWWDALLLLPLDAALGGTGWAVVDSRSLRSLPFFGWVGALPLDRSSPQRSRECLQACADLLDRPGRGVWVFPQGRQRPAHLRPLDLKTGLGVMHARSPVDLVAVSINYVFLERSRPAAVVRFSAPIAGASLAGASPDGGGPDGGGPDGGGPDGGGPDCASPDGGDGETGAALLAAMESALLDGLDAIDVAVMAATDGRRARTHPQDPLPGFVPLVAPARWPLPRGFGKAPRSG